MAKTVASNLRNFLSL